MTSPVSGLTRVSAAVRPSMRSSSDSMTPLPLSSTIAVTSTPRMSLLRTLTSSTSLLRMRSMASSVSGVPLAQISMPLESMTAFSTVLPSIFSAMDLRIAARKPSSGAPRETVSMTLVWFRSSLISIWLPRRESFGIWCSMTVSISSLVRRCSAGKTMSPVSGSATSRARTRPMSLSRRRLTAWRHELARRARSRTRSMPNTSQSSSRTMTS